MTIVISEFQIETVSNPGKNITDPEITLQNITQNIFNLSFETYWNMHIDKKLVRIDNIFRD